MRRRGLLLALLLAALSACDGNSERSNTQPTLAFSEPATDVTYARGALVAIDVRYADDDPDDVALTTIVADGDGDLGTPVDQYVLGLMRPEQDGLVQTVTWDLAAVPPGAYTIVATTWDGRSDPVVATAPGRVTVADVAGAWRDASDLQPQHVATAADGSIVVAGTCGPFAVFGEGQPNQATVSGGIFAARYAPDGTLAWATQLANPGAGTNFAFVGAAAPGADGSCLVAGDFSGTLTFGVGQPNQTTLTSSATNDVFVALLDDAGALAWVRMDGGAAAADEAVSATELADGSWIVAGTYILGSIEFGVGEPSHTVLNPIGQLDMYLARYRADGTLAWARAEGNTQTDYPFRVAGLSDGTFLFGGRFETALTLGAGQPNQTTLNGTGLFFAWYAADGALVRARRDGSSNASAAAYTLVLSADDSFHVLGAFSPAMTLGVGDPNQTALTSGSVYVAHYGGDGALVWAQAEGAYDAAGVAPFPDGSCAVYGRIVAPTPFAWPTRVQILDPADGPAFLARYDAAGRRIWLRQDAGDPVAVTLRPNHSCLCVGTFNATAVFGRGEPRETHLEPGGAPSLYFARCNADGGY